ncbi:endonuclease [Motiliproteus sp. SC1-56]|uniref:endonuclease n=1 Tax=Motiliproteus sp. SC1-56 TaxID=2799565 RepID=UPI001A8D8B5A|nr:endonuclease [Motiliproteus sp. SC1-56]
MKRLLLASALALSVFPLQAAPPESFYQAKKLAAEVYADQQKSFYCGCDYHAKGKKLVPDLASCGYKVRKEVRRANRIEWEHVVPAWAFGHQLQCWQDGGRKNCRKTSEKFRLMEADLMNLVPTIGEINGNRSNYSFAELEGPADQYGTCNFKVDFKARKARPTDAVKGDIARIYFYMRDAYGLRISDTQTKLFAAWDRLDPVDEREAERTRKIAEKMR